MSGNSGFAHRKILLWIFALSAAPFVLATLMYFFGKPTPKTTGVLLEPIHALKRVDLPSSKGLPIAFPHGKWLLLMASPQECNALCQSTLYRMHQVRVAQGPQMLRLERVWLGGAKTDPHYAGAERDGVTVQIDTQSLLISQLPKSSDPLEGSIYLLDPHGNLVMRYDNTVVPGKMIREIGKIMKINNGIG